MVSFRRYGVLVALLALGFVANRPVHASDAESYADGQQDFDDDDQAYEQWASLNSESFPFDGEDEDGDVDDSCRQCDADAAADAPTACGTPADQPGGDQGGASTSTSADSSHRDKRARTAPAAGGDAAGDDPAAAAAAARTLITTLPC